MNGPTVDTSTSPFSTRVAIPPGSDTSATAVSSPPPSSRDSSFRRCSLRAASTGVIPRSTMASAVRRPVYPVAPKRTIRPAMVLARRRRPAFLDHRARLLDCLRHRLLHALEVPAGQGHEAHRRLGHDRGRAPVLLEQPDLPEEVAGAEIGHVLVPAQNLGLSLLDGHELVGEVALADEVGPLVHRLLLGEGRDLRELLVIDVLEQ